jgi:hypothetical protein
VLATDPASQRILTDLKRSAFLQQADFTTPYAELAHQLPLGEEPMLVTDVQLDLQDPGVQLTLQDLGATAGQENRCQLRRDRSHRPKPAPGLTGTEAGTRRSQALRASMPQRASAASSLTLASTHWAPCGVCSFFQKGAWVLR